MGGRTAAAMRRQLGVALGLLGLGCGAIPLPAPGRAVAPPPQTWAGDDCPYLRVFVDWMKDGDLQLQESVANTYSDFLHAAGFLVTQDPSRAYFFVGSHAMPSIQNDEMLIWSVSTEARPEIVRGRSQPFSQRIIRMGMGQLTRVSDLHEIPRADLHEFASLAAGTAAEELLPRARRRCDNLDFSLREDEEHLQRIRQELTEEIQRVRWERRRQRKGLELGGEE
jgi:hypothetical protein